MKFINNWPILWRWSLSISSKNKKLSDIYRVLDRKSALHTKWSYPFRISSVNVTKSTPQETAANRKSLDFVTYCVSQLWERVLIEIGNSSFLPSFEQRMRNWYCNLLSCYYCRRYIQHVGDLFHSLAYVLPYSSQYSNGHLTGHWTFVEAWMLIYRVVSTKNKVFLSGFPQ